MCSSHFNLTTYYELLDTHIHNILVRPEKYVLTYDILDTEKTNQNKLLALHLLTFQMPMSIKKLI